MSLDPDRLQAAAAALAGGVFWGLFDVSTTLLAGGDVSRADTLRACANVLLGIGAGVLAGYFLAPGVASFIPWPSLRDLHVVGFASGALAWVIAPYAFSFAKAWSARKAKDLGK